MMEGLLEKLELLGWKDGAFLGGDVGVGVGGVLGGLSGFVGVWELL